MVDCKGYDEYLKENFDWMVFSGEENQDMYEVLWNYEPKLAQVDTAYYRFQRKYEGDRDPAPYEGLGQLLETRKRFINTIHFEYGKLLFHQVPYEALEKIDLISEEKLLTNCQFADIMEEFESERNAHQDIPGEDTPFMRKRFELFKCEMKVSAHAFLCAGYLEEKRRTELLRQYAS